MTVTRCTHTRHGHRMRTLRHLVLGAGQVGTAVAEVLTDVGEVALRDVDPTDDRADVLHVCIPWSPGFVDAVKGAVTRHRAELVVVHSTVPVGTCDPHGWVHSPVRGRHPNLAPSLRTFTKHFGGHRAAEAADAWAPISKTTVHPRAVETEAGKLWELVQYGLQVRVCQAIYEWCMARGLDPDVVYRQFAEEYNAGYTTLGLQRFARPVLDYVPGPIGGHCVTQNAPFVDHPAAEIVQRGWA